MSDDKLEGVDTFLTDEEDADPNVAYVKPNYIETTLTSGKKMECRNIVKTINEYGVSQRQKLFLVYLLALELEDQTLVRGIARLVGESQNRVQDAKIIVSEPPKKKLIV